MKGGTPVGLVPHTWRRRASRASGRFISFSFDAEVALSPLSSLCRPGVAVDCAFKDERMVQAFGSHCNCDCDCLPVRWAFFCATQSRERSKMRKLRSRSCD
jgi:hypothetical protein